MFNISCTINKLFLRFVIGTSISYNVTTALPLSQKSPTNLTSSNKHSVQSRNISTQVNPTLSYERNASPSLSGEEIYHPKYIQTSSTTSQPPIQSTTTSLSNSSPAIVTTESSKHPSEGSFVNKSWAELPVGSISLNPVQHNKTKPNNSLTKELSLEVLQRKQEEVFIRRKHKGPYYESDKKVTRPSERPLVVLTRFKGSNSKKTNDSPSSKGVSPSNVKSGKTQIQNRTKSRLLANTRRPKHFEVHSTAMKLSTTKKPKYVRKRPISMGIPASSTVVLSRKSTSTQAPTPVAYNNPESDEYYASYDEYSGVVAYNNSGEGTWHVTKLHLAIVEEVKMHED